MSITTLEIIKSPFFKDFTLTCFTVLFTIYVKAFSRSTQDSGILKREDFAIGIELCINSLVIFIAKLSDLVLSTKIITPDISVKISASLFLILAIVFVCIIFHTEIWRRFGWKKNNAHPRIMEPKIIAIVISDSVGILLLGFVVFWYNF